jgi:hypothetical protein
MIGFPRFWDASFPMRPFYRSHPHKAVRQRTVFESERASFDALGCGIVRCMERTSAGEGNSPQTPPEPLIGLAHRSDRDERCAYGRLVARELEAMRQSDGDAMEPQSLRTRIRRWCSQPMQGGNFPAPSPA